MICYRKPIEVEAVQYLSHGDNFRQMQEMGARLRTHGRYCTLEEGRGMEPIIRHKGWVVKERYSDLDVFQFRYYSEESFNKYFTIHKEDK